MRFFSSLLFFLFISCDDNPKNIALGTLERDRIAHTATANEVIVALPVLPGNLVKKGTIIVKLDDTLQKTRVAKAIAEVSQSRANLQKLRNGARAEELAIAKANLDRANASLVETKSIYKRSKKLLEKNIIGKADFDAALASRDVSLASLEIAREQLLELRNGARIEDLRIAEAHLESAIATLENENKKLSNLTITATRDGILDNLPWNLGERVTIGSPLAIVLASKAPFARIYVPEPYRVKMKLGSQMIVHVDGLDKKIIGKLTWISTEPAFTPYYALNQEERSRLMYLAKVQLADSEFELPNGIPAQVELP